MKGFFITGTDTEIGKTCVSAGPVFNNHLLTDVFADFLSD